MARTTKKDSSAKATRTPASQADMQSRQERLEGQMHIIQWVVGFGFGLVLIVLSIAFGILVPFTLNNTTQNTEIRTELHSLDKKHDSLKRDFDAYKSQTPPKNPQ